MSRSFIIVGALSDFLISILSMVPTVIPPPPPDGVQSDIDEDVIDLGSIASCSLNFEWVDFEDDDPRNYSLYVHREFHVDATRRELELARRIDDMEAALLSLSESLPPRSRQNVRNTVFTVFSGFRELLANEFREHRRLFEFSS